MQRPSFVRAAKFARLALPCILPVIDAARASAQDYRVERIASGLNQPTFITQAPGDPSNILYFTERTTNTIGGFDVVNQMGKVWRYDVDTRSKSLVLDLSSRTVRQDTGLTAIAFHPDFNTPSTDGFGKVYVSSSEASASSGPVNRLEEYTIGAGGTASFSRTIFQYTNSSSALQNHTLNWIGFDPTATGPARTQLYASTGDGNHTQAFRPSQDPNDVQGKFLRLDVSNATPTPQVYITGVRNASRASFDRANGDLYWGDVGEVVREEINFLKAGTNSTPPPADFGWPQREGMENGIQSPFATTNPYTGASSRNPIREYPHVGGGEAAIGGYVYRGPIASLQGKYFYGDFVKNTVFALDFDRETDPFAFNGANGTLTNMTTPFNATSTLYDPTDPNYTQANVGNIWGIDHIVSFGEDNAGNMYIVDFGHGTGFAGQYPGAGLGEIFRISTITSVWNVNSNGNWATGGNWRIGAPNAIAAKAVFGGVITAPRTVTVNAAQTVGAISFDNANAYTVGGTSTLTMDSSVGNAAISVISGNAHTISAPIVLNDDLNVTVTPATATLTISGSVSATGQAITKDGAGAVRFATVRAAALTVNAGTVDVIPNGSAAGTNKVGALAIAGGAAFDLRDNNLVTGTDAATVTALIAQARNNGPWNMPGLTSTNARANSSTNLGVLTGAEYTDIAAGNGTFSGQTYTPTDTLVKYTWNGDTNFNGVVNFDDYVRVDVGFNTNLTGWANGDFNFSGGVNFDDYVLIDIAFNTQSGTLGRAIQWVTGEDQSESGRAAAGVERVIEHFEQFGAPYGQAFLAAVPEPISLFWCAPLCLLRRRRS